jgi:hypothetical protein
MDQKLTIDHREISLIPAFLNDFHPHHTPPTPQGGWLGWVAMYATPTTPKSNPAMFEMVMLNAHQIKSNSFHFLLDSTMFDLNDSAQDKQSTSQFTRTSNIFDFLPSR